MKTAFATLCLAFLTLNSIAKAPSTPLQCGSAGNIKPTAEMQLVSDDNIYTVQLTYVTAKPSNQEIEKALRSCLAVAAKADGTKDILATAWLRKRPSDKPNDDEMLNPFGGMKYISYKASDKSIAVRELKLQKK